MPPSTPPETTATSRADTLDDALDRLSEYSYVDGAGMATHGPMGAEALSALGLDHLVAGWVEAYKALHPTIDGPPPVDPLQPEHDESWRAALGDPDRLADWNQMFNRELEEQPWPQVVERWVPRLLPGYGGAFTHGLLRTAHAVRTIQSTSSPQARAELASGLAYWAGTYRVLPGRPELRGDLTLEDAVAGVPRPSGGWNPIEAGTFSRIHELDGFAEAVEALGPPTSASEPLSDLSLTFARAMVANPDVMPFGLVHALTPVHGARTLLPYLPEMSIEQMYARLWQVNAAVTAGFLSPGSQSRPRDDIEPMEPAELIERAALHREPHALKYTEACISEHTRRPDPAYLRAAQHVIEQVPAW